MFADGGQVQGPVAGKVGNAETAADVEQAQRPGGVFRQGHGQVEGLGLGLDDGFRAQVLGAAEDVEAHEFQVQGFQVPQHLRDPFRVDAELGRPAAHFHARRLEFEIGIDAQGHPRAQAVLAAQARQGVQLVLRLHIDHDAGRGRGRQFPRRLAGPREADGAGLDTGVQRHPHLPQGGHVQTVHLGGDELDHRRHGVGLDRIMQMYVRGQGSAEGFDPPAYGLAFVGVERCAPHPLCQLRHRQAADVQAIVYYREVGKCGMCFGSFVH